MFILFVLTQKSMRHALRQRKRSRWRQCREAVSFIFVPVGGGGRGGGTRLRGFRDEERTDKKLRHPDHLSQN
ncbi:MAG: hypothetical protein KKH21_06830 [Gammaproteobacteria bacterium]|nr:hypothetical protein [Gammaproteobacteria bacterium]MBU0828302.1 hypothetical protein [Gammaproteobacteria bacterium]MBU0890589.1 hypothetical protein [Gammaproteobacteria bacterium]MBU1504640.1 hypothetical protein [Gammaproteobacteria bacterium]MBU1819696.1 hypothetical protein [Gammaproteobacteria bacterium]